MLALVVPAEAPNPCQVGINWVNCNIVLSRLVFSNRFLALVWHHYFQGIEGGLNMFLLVDTSYILCD